MTNRVAIVLLVLLVASAALDYALETGAWVFLGRKLLGLIETMAVWR